MKFIEGTHRNQIFFATLDDQVSADNSVRLIDAFIDKLELEKLGFTAMLRVLHATLLRFKIPMCEDTHPGFRLFADTKQGEQQGY